MPILPHMPILPRFPLQRALSSGLKYFFDFYYVIDYVDINQVVEVKLLLSIYRGFEEVSRTNVHQTNEQTLFIVVFDILRR